MKRTILLAAALLVSTTSFAADAPPAMTAQQKAMMEKMTKAATPGPQHEMLKKLAGDWNAKVRFQSDPSQPWQESASTSTITMLMDGRYCQEVVSGQMMGGPFNGVGLTGYDNVIGKYVGTWIDNFGTGIETMQGTADASGKVITWSATMSDPASGKLSTNRMVTTIVDDDHHTLDMYTIPPGAKKEMKTMTIEYTRK